MNRVNNVLELGQLAETFKNKLLLQACAEFITNDGTIEIEDTQAEKMPKLVSRINGLLNKQLKKQKEKEQARMAAKLLECWFKPSGFKPTDAGNRLRARLAEEQQRKEQRNQLQALLAD